MTREQIDLIDSLEEWRAKGYIVDTRWAFCGFKCRIWEIHNDHDVDIELKSYFATRWDAYKEALKYLSNNYKI